MKILIVDDDPMVLQVLRTCLKAKGHMTVSATDGTEALEALRRTPVDAIISDVLMPSMDGYRLCDEVRRSESLRHLPFIFHTAAFTTPEDERLCFEVGGDRVLRKSASPEELVAAVQAAVLSPRRRLTKEPAPRGVVLKEYSKRLVGKLEEKNLELRAALDELRHAGELSAAILDSSLDAVVAIDHAGRIVEFNPAAEASFGMARDRALGRLMVDLIIPQRLREAHRQGFARYIATGKGLVLGRRLELEALRADGTEFPIELSIRAIRAGPEPMFTAFIRDITERRRADETLRESERRFNDMLRHLELISLMLDDNGRIVYCNDYLLRLTGWQRKEVLGKDWFQLFVPPENAGLKSVFHDVLADVPAAWHHEDEILTRSGERRLIRWNNTVLRSASGKAIGTASIGEDITARRQAEREQERRAEELERFHRLSVGRELQMIELKHQVNRLSVQAGQEPPYPAAVNPGPGP